MAAKPLQIVNFRPTEVEANISSAGAADAGKLVALDANGLINSNMMPVGIGADTASIVTSENLAAGDFVNIYDNAGTPTARKADASTTSAAKRAMGFVLAATTSPAAATVYFEGRNTGVAGLTGGTTYVLSHSTPGGVLALASGTTTAGQILQIVGDAYAAGGLAVELKEPIVRG